MARYAINVNMRILHNSTYTKTIYVSYHGLDVITYIVWQHIIQQHFLAHKVKTYISVDGMYIIWFYVHYMWQQPNKSFLKHINFFYLQLKMSQQLYATTTIHSREIHNQSILCTSPSQEPPNSMQPVQHKQMPDHKITPCNAPTVHGSNHMWDRLIIAPCCPGRCVSSCASSVLHMLCMSDHSSDT